MAAGLEVTPACTSVAAVGRKPDWAMAKSSLRTRAGTQFALSCGLPPWPPAGLGRAGGRPAPVRQLPDRQRCRRAQFVFGCGTSLGRRALGDQSLCETRIGRAGIVAGREAAEQELVGRQPGQDRPEELAPPFCQQGPLMLTIHPKLAPHQLSAPRSPTLPRAPACWPSATVSRPRPCWQNGGAPPTHKAPRKDFDRPARGVPTTFRNQTRIGRAGIVASDRPQPPTCRRA
jgi:hypothetical protein